MSCWVNLKERLPVSSRSCRRHGETRELEGVGHLYSDDEEKRGDSMQRTSCFQVVWIAWPAVHVVVTSILLFSYCLTCTRTWTTVTLELLVCWVSQVWQARPYGTPFVTVIHDFQPDVQMYRSDVQMYWHDIPLYQHHVDIQLDITSIHLYVTLIHVHLG